MLRNVKVDHKASESAKNVASESGISGYLMRFFQPVVNI
jgi:hypothetical protein